MNRAEFWGKKIMEADSLGDLKLVRSVFDEAKKEIQSRTTTHDGVILWLFRDGSVLRATSKNNGEVGHLQWTE